jgi:DNA-binding MarR family transcriptional regulator
MSRSRNPGGTRAEDGPHIGALLRMAWQRVRARIYSGVEHDGYSDLNPAHVALFRFETIDGRRPTQVAESMQITKQSVNDLIRDLERHGYAQYRTDPRDHRARLIHLTARGRRLEAAAHKYAIAADCELEQELGQERFRELHATLLKINKLSG